MLPVVDKEEETGTNFDFTITSITIYAKTSASFRHGEPIRRLDDTRIHGVAFYEEIVVVVVT